MIGDHDLKHFVLNQNGNITASQENERRFLDRWLGNKKSEHEVEPQKEKDIDYELKNHDD